MVAKKAPFPLQKVTLKLYEGDFRQLADLYPRSGANKVIREMVRRHITMCLEATQARLAQQPIVEALDITLPTDEEMAKDEQG